MNTLLEENAALRDYLDRMLIVLEEKNEGHDDPSSVLETPPAEPQEVETKPEVELSLKMAYMERRLKRAENNLGDLVWMLDRLEHSRQNG